MRYCVSRDINSVVGCAFCTRVKFYFSFNGRLFLLICYNLFSKLIYLFGLCFVVFFYVYRATLYDSLLIHVSPFEIKCSLQKKKFLLYFDIYEPVGKSLSNIA